MPLTSAIPLFEFSYFCDLLRCLRASRMGLPGRKNGLKTSGISVANLIESMKWLPDARFQITKSFCGL